MNIRLNKLLFGICLVGFLSNIAAYNSVHLSQLKYTQQCKNCDLTEIKLIDHFGGDNRLFDKIDVSESNLSKAILVLELNDSNFISSNLNKANFLSVCRNCNFTNANFEDLNTNLGTWSNDIKYLDLDLSSSNFTNVNFKNAVLENFDFTNAQFAGANFAGANLKLANFTDSDITFEQLQSAQEVCGLFLPNGKQITIISGNDGTLEICEGFLKTGEIFYKKVD